MQSKMLTSKNLLLIIIILVGAIFRFGWTGVHSFSFDEARVSQIALKMVYEGEFARLGMQSSVGVPNFPATVWLYAIPYAIFGPNVQIATWFTGLVSLLAIPAVYQLGRWRGGEWAGFSAAALFALSPFMLVYGRNIWSQNFLAPLTVFWLYAGYRGAYPLITSSQTSVYPQQHQGKIALAIFIFLGGFIGQVHIAGLAMALPTAYIFFRFKLWRRIWPVLVGGMAAALCAFPALYTIWRFGDGARADLDTALAEPSVWNHEVWRMMVQLPLNNGWEFVWLGRNYEWPTQTTAFIGMGYGMLGLLGVIGLMAVIKQAVNRFQQDVDPADSLWLNLVIGSMLATPLLFWYSGSDVALHYILPAFPGGILLISTGGQTFVTGRLRQSTAIYTFGLVLVVCALYAAQLTHALNKIQTELVLGGMGTPLAYPAAALDQALSSHDQAIVVAHSDQIEFEGDPAVFHVLGYGRNVRLVDGTSSFLVADDPAEYVFTFDFIPAYGELSSLFAEPDTADSARRTGEPPYKLVSLPNRSPQGFEQLNNPIPLINGVQLIGYRVRQNGDQLEWVAQWDLLAEGTGQHVQQFNHLYLEGDSEPFEIKDIYTSSRAWRDGDTLYTWTTFTVPEGRMPDFIHTGMYTLPDVQRIPRLVPEGEDALFPIQIDLN